MMLKKINYTILFLFVTTLLFAQTKVKIYGYVVDENNRGVEFANVSLRNLNVGTTCNKNGYYEILAEIKDSATIIYSKVGYSSIKHTIYPKLKNIQISVDLLSISKDLGEINVIGQKRQMSNMDLIDASKYRLTPNASGGIESLLITFAGVNSSNELSSQYNVRGGNFDENIVYVNGIEIYRPLLVRAGQQEGLSFINPDMVKNVGFSAGGFDAQYGDKMSSVLNVNYKRPSNFEATASVSLLGASAFLGTANKKFSQMHGVRYKTSSSLLGTLDTKGEYNPAFIDYQSYLTFQLKPKWELTFLGNFSQNSYQFKPQDRETSFGTYNMGRKLNVFFEGQEKDLFRTSFGALTLNWKPTVGMKLSFLSSAFYTNERETFDILGEYVLSEVKMDPDPTKQTGESLGVGKYHQHARNKLNAAVVNFAHLGELDLNSHKMRWGLNLQRESINDKLNEWEWRDSAGYSLPYSDKQLNLYYNLKSINTLSSWRTAAYFQDTYKWRTEVGSYSITGGLRANYWTFNKELLVSPRVSVAFLPFWKRDFSFRLATGVYYQTPFYKEVRDTLSDALGNVNVTLNSNINAQRSVHFVLGGDYYFRAWGRPFKFTTEAYLKLMDRVITYSVDNVRVLYSGVNDAKAYTLGVDFKVFGELVPGTDSWINFSLMNSKQDIIGDSYINKTFNEDGDVIASNTVNPGWVSSPSEQRFSFSILLQDYFPNNSKYKLQLRGVVSDGLPFGPPRNIQYRSFYRTPSYRRVDIGVSRILISDNDKTKRKSFLKNVKSAWLNLEVFNLLDFKNVNSYYWVTDVYNQRMAVPNYLTGRQLNLKLIVDFK